MTRHYRFFILILTGVALAALAPRGLRAEDVKAPGELLTQNIVADIAEKTLPSVVSVYVKADIREQFRKLQEQRGQQGIPKLDDEELRQFFEQREKEMEEGGEGEGGDNKDPHKSMFETRTSGSGVIISEDGYIVTNFHIVGDAAAGQVSVQLSDDTEIPGDKVKIVAVDDLIDLAILKIDAGETKLKAMQWGDSDTTRIGDWVVAIGNPLELRGSVSLGIISAKSRQIEKVPIEHLLQTDAMINPGNSGGALVNLKGELIGINMAIATNTGFFQGIGFAIPSNDAREVANDVVQHGRVRRGYIGIEMLQLDRALRESLGADDTEKGEGIGVAYVVPGAPADKAGIQAYDVITEVDGKLIKETKDLLAIIAGKKVGDEATIKVLREAKGETTDKTLVMKVAERPSSEELLKMRALPGEEQKKEEDPGDLLGMTLKPFARGGVKGMEIAKVRPRSQAAKADLAVGVVILEANRKEVQSQSEWDAVLDAAPDGETILLQVLREGAHALETVEKPEAEK